MMFLWIYVFFGFMVADNDMFYLHGMINMDVSDTWIFHIKRSHKWRYNISFPWILWENFAHVNIQGKYQHVYPKKNDPWKMIHFLLWQFGTIFKG